MRSKIHKQTLPVVRVGSFFSRFFWKSWRCKKCDPFVAVLELAETIILRLLELLIDWSKSPRFTWFTRSRAEIVRWNVVLVITIEKPQIVKPQLFFLLLSAQEFSLSLLDFSVVHVHTLSRSRTQPQNGSHARNYRCNQRSMSRRSQSIKIDTVKNR